MSGLSPATGLHTCTACPCLARWVWQPQPAGPEVYLCNTHADPLRTSHDSADWKHAQP